jgi:hypothetical protein
MEIPTKHFNSGIKINGIDGGEEMAETASEYLARRRRELTGQSTSSAETGESYLARRRRELSGEVQTRESVTSKLALKEKSLEPQISEKTPYAVDFKAAQPAQQQQSVFQDKLPAANLIQTGQGIQSTLKDKVPAANLVQQTGRGPANASEINNPTIWDRIDDFNAFGDRMQSSSTFGLTTLVDQAFTKIGPESSRQAAQERLDRAKEAKGGIVADVLGSLVSGKTAYDVGGKLVSPIVKNASKGVQGLAKGAAAGNLWELPKQISEEVGERFGGEQQSLKQRAANVAISTALGGLTDLGVVAGGAISKGIKNQVVGKALGGATGVGSVGAALGTANELQEAMSGQEQPISGRLKDVGQYAGAGALLGLLGGAGLAALLRKNGVPESEIARIVSDQEVSPRQSEPKVNKISGTNEPNFAEYSGTPTANEVEIPLSREQIINRKYLNDEKLTQEEMDFMVSDEWNNDNLIIRKNAPVENGPVPEQPASPVSESVPNIPKYEAKTTGVRSNYKTMQESGNISERLKSDIDTVDKTYQVAKNKDTVTRANKNVESLKEAEDSFLLNESSSSAESIATGYRVMQELDKSGEHARSLKVADKLAKDLTAAGQTVQAASLIQRLSPEGQLLNLVRTASKAGKTVTEADKIKFQDLAAKVQENIGAGKRENAVNDILDRLEKGENVSVSEIKQLSDFLDDAKGKVDPANKGVKAEVKDKLPKELNNPRTRDKVISFLEAQEKAAQERINKRKGRLNSLPVDEWTDYAILISTKVAKGIIKAETHVEYLVKQFGEEVRPVATQIFQKAQEIVDSVSGGAAKGNLASAERAFRKISGQETAEKAIIKETAAHVRQLIEDAKNGKLTQDGVQKLRDYSDEIAEMLAEKKPSVLQTDEQKYLQKVKQLAKKIADVEETKTTTSQDNKEISSLLRQVAKLTDEPLEKLKPDPKLNQALSDIAHDVMEKTRPTPKPTTLQEKIVEKYIKANPEVTPKDIESLRKLSKSLTDLQGLEKTKADMAMQKILNSYEKSSIMDKVNAIRYIAMLFNSGTQAINAISGPAMATTARVADMFGVMIDSTLSAIMKKPRTTTLYGANPVKFTAEYFKALKTGAKAGWEGVNPAGIQGSNEIRGLTYKGKYNPLSYLERTLGAVAKGADYAAYSAIYKGEMEKQGFLDALENGIKRSNKDEIKRHIRKFVNDPPEAALEQADRIAKNSTFQRNDTLGGETANWLNSGSGKVQKVVSPVVRTVFPFVRTPINIASTAVTMTPGGIIKGLIQLSSKSNATQREAIRTLSLGLTGTGLSAVGYYLNQLGIITGSNDSGNKDVDNIREQVGKGKYRFNTSALQRYVGALLDGQGADAAAKAAKYQEGDKQFDYNKLQPLAFPLAIGAEASTLKGKPNQVTGTVSGAAGSLFGMSTLRGVQDVFQPQFGGTQGEKATGVATRLGESFLKSFSPSALAQEARRQDPVMRKTAYNDGIIADVKDYYKSRTPGLSQSLPANKTTLGQDKLNAPGIKGQYLNPYKSEVARYTQAGQFIVDLMERTGDTSIAPSAPAKKVRGKDENDESVTISIPPKRYEKLQEDIGNEIINRVMEIEGGTDDELITQLEEIYSEVRKEYMDEVKEELGLQVN